MARVPVPQSSPSASPAPLARPDALTDDELNRRFSAMVTSVYEHVDAMPPQVRAAVKSYQRYLRRIVEQEMDGG